MSAVSMGDLAQRLASQADPDRRGPDPRVRRNSIDENDAAAQPWARNRFGSSVATIAATESLLDLAKEMQREAHGKFPRPVVRELKDSRGALAQELADWLAAPPGTVPVGRAATIRIELARIDALLDEHRLALTRTDVDVLASLLGFLKRSGEWIASWAGIALYAGCERKSVGRALARFEHHGFLDRIRRSRRVIDHEGQFAPQREQIACAFVMTTASKLAGRLRERFLQIRARRLKRMTGSKPGPATPPWPTDPDLRKTLQSLETLALRANPT